MMRLAAGVALGWALGAGLGASAAWLIHPAPTLAPPSGGWTSYPTLAGPVLEQRAEGVGPFRWWLFLGVLAGGGSGMIAGAAAGGALAAERLKASP
ncbi:MAG: hypothetical protein K2W96_02815 [Gemmataceae bacterium]|nr:hypothetical protein [Gemmataceae bacterium]